MNNLSSRDQGPVLSLREIRHSYQSGDAVLDVLQGVDFSLYAGEVVALVAPSGSGKSTLLHIAGLLETPCSGHVIIAGEDTASMSEMQRTITRRNRIGFVYQFHHLLAEFTALENVVLPQMTRGTPAREASARAEKLLGSFGLAGRMHHLPGKLSGGEQQRVAIARALANEPSILLADEPTGNLDVVTSDVVFDELLKTAREHRLAAIIATHNMELAQRMDKVIVLDKGKLVAKA